MKMFRMLRKTGTIMAKSNGSNMGSFSSVEEAYDVVDDLSSWEFVDPSSSEDEEQDLCSFTDEDDVINDDVTSKNGKEEEDWESESPGEVISAESLSVSPPQMTLTTFDVCYDDEQEEEVHDDDADDEDGFGLDDELVPWMLENRFGRQRIRKMGKRDGSRVNKSKRGPRFYNRPGAVYGKHGLGVQHCFI